MNKASDLTEMVFILDKSGSMEALESDTIGGFNSMIAKQKTKKGKAIVTTVLFDSSVFILHDAVDIEGIGKMTDNDYIAGGCTALLDAVGTTITNVGKRQKNMKRKPNHTVFVIITDGMENASREYTYSKIHSMIGSKRKNAGWEFIFLGANIDVKEMAENLGIRKSMSAEYHADSRGTAINFAVVGSAIECLRETGEIKEEWKNDIDHDFRKRR